MLGARKRAEEIGFLKPGEQPYFHAGAPVHVLGFADPPKGTIFDPIAPTVAFAGHLAKSYAPGGDALLSGPMARTVHAAGTEKIFNLFGWICAVNAFSLWRAAPDEHGCRLYLLVNDRTRKLQDDPPCLTDLIKADPPASAQAKEDYERKISRAASAAVFDNVMYIEKSLVWSR